MLAQEWVDSGSYLKEEKIQVFCPKCKSDDVVLEEIEGMLSFYQCNKCGCKK